jgi:hypothetical protein
MKRYTLTAALLALTAIAFSVIAADKEKKKSKEEQNEPAAAQKTADEGDRWMQAKLHSSQQIFAGLTQGNLEVVKKRAQFMAVVNVLEDWLKKSELKKKSAYQGQMNAFEFANKELIRTADDGDIDGALEAWVKLSRSCVECHKLIRDVEK